MALLLYAVTLFVSAFLLFLVQPIIGQKILPKLGGTPSVWNTCVVFFQLALLIGYAYTHFTTKMPVRRQILVHCGLLFIPFLILLPGLHPFNVDDFKPITGGNPILPTLLLLTAIVGIPFFVVSTTAPLLQKWFGSTGHPAAKDPYFLYGASNFGSMLSLLMYPFVFEPWLGLEGQSWFYTIGYMVLVAIVISCGAMAFLAPPSVQLPTRKDEDPERVPSMAPEPPPVTDIAPGPPPSAAQTTSPSATGITSDPRPGPGVSRPAVATGIKKGGKKAKGRDLAKSGPPPAVTTAAASAITGPSFTRPYASDPDEITWGRRLRWIGLAAVPSSLMLGVTTYMSTDISAIPLFWVLPLALYLLSFILVFMRWPFNWLEQAHEFVLYLQPVFLVLLALLMAIGGLGVVWMIIVMLLAFTLTALACHGEMAKDRPSATHLTEFYLLMSVGGAVGGLFNGIIAPVIFPWGVVEFGLALMVAGLLRPTMRDSGWLETLLENMGQTDAGRHATAKGGRKTTKSGGPATGITLFLDFALPFGIFALLGILLWTIKPRTNEAMFWVCILPMVCTACFLARPLRYGLSLGVLLLLTGYFLHGSGDIVYQTRSYFGLLRVREYEGGTLRSFGIPYTNLMHGTTDHGMALQKTAKEDYSRVATTYYHRQGPVGICMDRFNWFPKEYESLSFLADLRMPASLVGLGVPSLGVNLPVAQLVGAWAEPPYAVIGMGTATMSSYGRPFQTCHFYEIDEQIRLLSLPANKSDRTYFGYVKAAKQRGANIEILMGDARLRMAMPWTPEAHLLSDGEKANPSTIAFDKRGGPEYFYHLMVVDAFSSDAIPRHLITKEAMEMYFRHLVVGHWGPWIEVNPKDPNVDLDGFRLDAGPAKYMVWEDMKEGDKVKKRQWIPGGVLCVHTSNRHLRLVPVVTDTAAKAVWMDFYNKDGELTTPVAKGGDIDEKTRLVANRGHDNAPGCQYLEIKDDVGHYTSEWVIVARDVKDMKHLVAPSKYSEWMSKAAEMPKNKGRIAVGEDYWTPQQPRGSFVWTDDHTDLMAVFRWPWAHGRD